ncbi:MAG: tRNA (adenosine(37)-N6)-threonylcarbamoyltransferase complex ATPase subunit type 1 TsaE [Candidatus Jorgensenbacteria bacterium]
MKKLYKISEAKPPKVGNAFRSHSPAATRKLAWLFARELAARGPRSAHATVVGLIGDLGSGKTTFIQGFARGLGIKHNVTSPTFVIFRNYKIPRHEFPPKADPPQAEMVNSYQFFCHMDAYRIRKISELAPLGFRKILADPKNILLVEWAENIRRALPRNATLIHFSHGKKSSERKIGMKTKLVDTTKLRRLTLRAF